MKERMSELVELLNQYDWGYDERKYASRRAAETPVCGFVLRIIADWRGQLRGLHPRRDSGFVP